MFENINIKKLVVWLSIIMACSLVLGTVVLFAQDGFPFDDKGKNTKKINAEKTFALQDIKDINVKSVSTDIKIIPWDGTDIKANLHGSATTGSSVPTLEAKSDKGTLDIEVKYSEKPLQMFSFNFFNIKLDVYIPKSYAENLSISTVSGDVSIDGFNFANLALDSVSGDVNASAVIASDMKFTTTSGDAKLQSFSGSMNFKSVSGDLNAEFIKYENDIEISTVSGDSNLKLPQDAQFQLDFQTVSGDFDSNLPIVLDKNRGKSVRGTIGDGKYKIHMDSTSGDFSVNR